MFSWNKSAIQGLEFGALGLIQGVYDPDEIRRIYLDYYNQKVHAYVSVFGLLLKYLCESGRSVQYNPPQRLTVPKRRTFSEEQVRAAAGPPPEPPARDQFRTEVPLLTLVERLLGRSGQYRRKVHAAAEQDQRTFELALAQHEQQLAAWEEGLAQVRLDLELKQEEEIRAIELHNAAIDAFEARPADDAKAVEARLLKALNTMISSTMEKVTWTIAENVQKVPLAGKLSVRYFPGVATLLIDARPLNLSIIPPRQFRLSDQEIPTPIDLTPAARSR